MTDKDNPAILVMHDSISPQMYHHDSVVQALKDEIKQMIYPSEYSAMKRERNQALARETALLDKMAKKDKRISKLEAENEQMRATLSSLRDDQILINQYSKVYVPKEIRNVALSALLKDNKDD